MAKLFEQLADEILTEIRTHPGFGTLGLIFQVHKYRFYAKQLRL
jgi:hypothetical protein